MPTYEYECEACGQRFERQQAITDAPIANCPTCRGHVRRLVTGGAGFIIEGSSGERHGRSAGSCAFERHGRTCCGRDERCGEAPCEDKG